jgi:ubiquinone/menaquinone biosynthesis C-methylase UbiE
MTHDRERQYRDQLPHLAVVRADKDSLDIGCGTGTLASATWRRTRPDGIAYGIDASPKMIARARWKTRRSELDVTLHFHGGDAAALPFRQ